MAEPPAGHYRRNVGVHRVNADRCRTGAGDGARGGQGTAGKFPALHPTAAKNGPAEHLPEPQTGIHRETSPCQITFWDDGIEGMSKVKNPL